VSSKLKLKLIYDRQSVGQSVSVSGALSVVELAEISDTLRNVSLVAVAATLCDSTPCPLVYDETIKLSKAHVGIDCSHCGYAISLSINDNFC
jgi:hypothetical protein